MPPGKVAAQRAALTFDGHLPAAAAAAAAATNGFSHSSRPRLLLASSLLPGLAFLRSFART